MLRSSEAILSRSSSPGVQHQYKHTARLASSGLGVKIGEIESEGGLHTHSITYAHIGVVDVSIR